MTDIVLIQPKTGVFDKINTRLPLGLLYAASHIKKEYKVKIIDQRFEGWKKKLNKEIKKSPLFVGTTCMTGPQIKYALEIAEFVKNKEIPTVFGGVHPTVLPKQTLAHPLVDIVVRGEGERTLLELADSFEKGKSLKDIKGISYKKTKQVHNPNRPFLESDEISLPPYDLIDMGRYSSASFEGEKSYSIMASRGCPFRCGFCYNSMEKMGFWRPFPIEMVLENASILVNEFGAKTLYFEDDNICTERQRFEILLKKLKKHSINLAFQGIRIDTLSRFKKETFDLMDSFRNISLDTGIESINPRILEMIDKSISPEMIKEVLNKLEKRKYVCKFNLLAGLPTENKSEIDNDIKFAIKLNKRFKKSYSLFNIYTPYPGTKLFDLAVKNGFIAPTDLESWSNFSQSRWLKTNNSWLSSKEREYLRNVSLLFMFATSNIGIKTSGKIRKYAISAYSPIAKARLISGNHSLFVEKIIAEKLFGF